MSWPARLRPKAASNRPAGVIRSAGPDRGQRLVADARRRIVAAGQAEQHGRIAQQGAVRGEDKHPGVRLVDDHDGERWLSPERGPILHPGASPEIGTSRAGAADGRGPRWRGYAPPPDRRPTIRPSPASTAHAKSSRRECALSLPAGAFALTASHAQFSACTDAIAVSSRTSAAQIREAGQPRKSGRPGWDASPGAAAISSPPAHLIKGSIGSWRSEKRKSPTPSLANSHRRPRGKTTIRHHLLSDFAGLSPPRLVRLSAIPPGRISAFRSCRPLESTVDPLSTGGGIKPPLAAFASRRRCPFPATAAKLVVEPQSWQGPARGSRRRRSFALRWRAKSTALAVSGCRCIQEAAASPVLVTLTAASRRRRHCHIQTRNG